MTPMCARDLGAVELVQNTGYSVAGVGEGLDAEIGSARRPARRAPRSARSSPTLCGIAGLTISIQWSCHSRMSSRHGRDGALRPWACDAGGKGRAAVDRVVHRRADRPRRKSRRARAWRRSSRRKTVRASIRPARCRCRRPPPQCHSQPPAFGRAQRPVECVEKARAVGLCKALAAALAERDRQRAGRPSGRASRGYCRYWRRSGARRHGVSTRAPAATQRAASGMSAVTTTSPRPGPLGDPACRPRPRPSGTKTVSTSG